MRRMVSVAVLLLTVGFAVAALGQPYVYVVDAPGTVKVLDTATNGVVGTIPVDPAPWYLAMAPDGTRLYGTHHSSDVVSVIDTIAKSVIETIDVPNPHSIVVAPTGFVYVTDDVNDTVSVIDPTTNSIMDVIDVGSHPRGIAASPDGLRVYVSNSVDGTISVIDTATRSVIDTIDVGVVPLGIAVSPDSLRVYVADISEHWVPVIDTVTHGVTWIGVGDGPSVVTVTPDGTRVYVGNYGDDTVSVIDTITNSVVDTIDVGESPRDIVVSPDGSRVYVSVPNRDIVLVIDTATNSVMTWIGYHGPQSLAVGPDRTRLLLPYFEVDHRDPQGVTTFLSVRNETNELAPITVSYYRTGNPETPQRVSEVLLPPKKVQPFDLRYQDLAEGDDGWATGWAVVESMETGGRIQGDYFRMNRAGNFASGERLVDLDTELCRSWTVRYFNGGPFDGGATFYFWVHRGVPAEDVLGPVASYTVYNEAGAMLVPPTELSGMLNETAFAIEAGDFPTPLPTFGVVELELIDAVGHVSVVMTASERYSVGLKAFCNDGR